MQQSLENFASEVLMRARSRGGGWEGKGRVVETGDEYVVSCMMCG